MLVPQFSIRWLFGATAVMAVLSMVGAFAARGHGWAIGILAGLGSLLLTFMAYVAFWLVAMAAGGLVRVFRSGFEAERLPESPFAMHKEAPQVLEPRESDS